MKRAGYEVRELRPQDEASLAQVLERAFRDPQPGRVADGAALWRWRFLENPVGVLGRVALFEGRVVGQYAAVGLPTWIAGREVLFAQARDAALDPEHRRGHEHPGLFVRLVRDFEEVHGRDDDLLVTFAFPDEKMRELARILLRYDTVRTQSLLSREVAQAPGERPPEVECLERFDHQARWLWERCCGAWGASTVRDERFLNWRFVDHPDAPYLIFGVRDGQGVLRGYAVYRAEGRLFPGAATLVDWLVPPEEPEVGDLLLRALTAQARGDRAHSLLTLVPEWSPWFMRFQATGFLVLPSPLVLMARSMNRRFDELWLRDHWWYQFGDTTLV